MAMRTTFPPPSRAVSIHEHMRRFWQERPSPTLAIDLSSELDVLGGSCPVAERIIFLLRFWTRVLEQAKLELSVGIL